MPSFPFKLLYPNGSVQHGSLDTPRKYPNLDDTRSVVGPLIKAGPNDPGDLEHVSIMTEAGERACMFVNEFGAIPWGDRAEPLPYNEAATKEYQRAYLRQNPKARPEDLSCVYGPAVVFETEIWR